jgi:hypothetical protein
LQVFADQVVPLLRRKGIFREAYETSTLRGHLGLPRPENAFTSSLGLAAESEQASA